MTQLYVNLPVKELNKTIQFFTHLGFTFNAQFTNENATCMVINEHISVMLLVEEFFKTFTPKQIGDAKTATECLLALSYDSRAAVDAMVAKAIEAGGNATMPAKDLGFMYQHGFEDLDGHLWEVFYMDAHAMPDQ
jgi:predicted lactoylglutathione lyase